METLHKHMLEGLNEMAEFACKRASHLNEIPELDIHDMDMEHAGEVTDMLKDIAEAYHHMGMEPPMK